MSGTKSAGENQYAATSMSSNPGGRSKTRSFDTSVGGTATTVALNATVNACAAAQDAVLKASRVVESRRIGLARTNESGGAVLSLEIVTNTGTVASTNQPATGGRGVGLTITTTVNTVPDPDVIGTVAVVNGGRGYVVGDIVTRLSATFRVTSVS